MCIWIVGDKYNKIFKVILIGCIILKIFVCVFLDKYYRVCDIFKIIKECKVVDSLLL